MVVKRAKRASDDANANKSAKKSKNMTNSCSDGASTGAQDPTMLDMCLNMLRCGVCHDRFKEVAITRCFHMFCKECTDKNLKNRNRKCPACGEKFGNDDVRQIFFTS